jgi:hypothetical protein
MFQLSIHPGPTGDRPRIVKAAFLRSSIKVADPARRAPLRRSMEFTRAFPALGRRLGRSAPV